MPKQTLSFTLFINELLYDILLKAYALGEMASTDDQAEQTAKIQELADENENIILRSIGKSYANLLSHLSEYLAEEGYTADNVLYAKTREKILNGVYSYGGKMITTEEGETENNDINISLRVPLNFNKAAKNDIAQSAHAYIVDNALAEWFSIAAKTEAETYASLASADLMRLVTALNKRIRPARTHTPTDINYNTDLRYE